MLDKDDILDALLGSLGAAGPRERQRLSRAADAVLRTVAENTRGAVVSSFWRRERLSTHVRHTQRLASAPASRAAGRGLLSLPTGRRGARPAPGPPPASTITSSLRSPPSSPASALRRHPAKES
jgi:hypothetical protein